MEKIVKFGEYVNEGFLGDWLKKMMMKMLPEDLQKEIADIQDQFSKSKNNNDLLNIVKANFQMKQKEINNKINPLTIENIGEVKKVVDDNMSFIYVYMKTLAAATKRGNLQPEVFFKNSQKFSTVFSYKKSTDFEANLPKNVMTILTNACKAAGVTDQNAIETLFQDKKEGETTEQATAPAEQGAEQAPAEQGAEQAPAEQGAEQAPAEQAPAKAKRGRPVGSGKKNAVNASFDQIYKFGDRIFEEVDAPAAPASNPALAKFNIFNFKKSIQNQWTELTKDIEEGIIKTVKGVGGADTTVVINNLSNITKKKVQSQTETIKKIYTQISNLDKKGWLELRDLLSGKTIPWKNLKKEIDINTDKI